MKNDQLMIDFQFEYSKQSVIRRVLILAFTAFLILLVSTFLFFNYISIWISITVTVLTPLLIFFFSKGRVKALGQAALFPDRITFELGKDKITFDFEDIKSYKIEYYHGAALNLRLKNKSKFRLLSSDSFCDSEQFGRFCSALEKTIDEYKSKNESSSIREKSILEKHWFLLLLVVLTAFVTIGMIYASFASEARPSSILISVGSLISLWVGYFTTKRTRKQRD